MQEAYNYIATQIAYMHDTKAQKVRRGQYGGGNLPAPYVIDRSVWKDKQVPVIYQPWQPLVVRLFERFREYDHSLSRIARYIEELPYLFPYPSTEDLQRYMVVTRMRQVPGGYTFSSADTIHHYFSNLMLGGYAKVGRDSTGKTLYLAGAFEPAVPLELLGKSYAAITGYHLDGTPYERKRYAIRSRATTLAESPAILHGLLESDDGAISFHRNVVKDRPNKRPAYTCHTGAEVDGHLQRSRVGIMRQHALWTVAYGDLDRIVVKRLCELSQYDSDMSERIRAFWDERKSGQVNQAKLLELQIEKAAAQIHRLDKLLTNPEVPLTADTERRYLQMLVEAEADQDRLMKEQASQDRQRDPEEVVPRFYQVLAHLPTEYTRLTPEEQKRLARLVIQDIRLNALSTHLFVLQISWQTGIASRPDVAVVWRGMSSPSNQEWTDEENELMRQHYSKGSQEDVMRALPRRAWGRIMTQAQLLGLRRTVPHAGPHPFNLYHRTISYEDLEAAANLVDDLKQ